MIQMSKALKSDSLFDCTRCGACCRSVALSPLTAKLDKGNGVCCHLNEDNNLCLIYENRPNICRINQQYEQIYKNHFSWKEFCEINYQSCKILQEKVLIHFSDKSPSKSAHIHGHTSTISTLPLPSLRLEQDRNPEQ